MTSYDYENQAWMKDGRYIRCGHPQEMVCGCFGRAFEGMTLAEVKAEVAATLAAHNTAN